MKHLLFALNVIILIIVIRKHSIFRPSIHLYSFYVLTIYGLFGSYATLYLDDWWLRKVSDASIVRAYYLFGLTYMVYGISVYMIQHKKIIVDIRRQEGIERSVFQIILVLSFVVSLLLIFPQSALRLFLSNPSVGAFTLAEARAAMGVNNSDLNKGVQYFQNVIIRYAVVLAYAYYAIRYIRIRQNKKWFIVAFIICFFTLSLSLNKASVVTPIIIVGIVQLLYGRKNIFMIATVGGIVVAILLLLYVLVVGASKTQSVGILCHRIFISQYVGMPVVLEAFPLYHGYIGLSALPGAMCAMLGRTHVSFGRVAMEYANPIGVDRSVAGYLSTVCFAEGYAIAGVAGVWVTLMVVILYMIAIDKLFSRIRSDVTGALYVVLLYRLSNQIMDGFTNLVLNYGVILCAIIVYFILGLKSRLAGRGVQAGVSCNVHRENDGSLVC